MKEGLQVRLLGTAETRFPALPQAAENAVQRFLGLHARQLVQLKLQRALRHSLLLFLFFFFFFLWFSTAVYAPAAGGSDAVLRMWRMAVMC